MFGAIYTLYRNGGFLCANVEITGAARSVQRAKGARLSTMLELVKLIVLATMLYLAEPLELSDCF